MMWLHISLGTMEWVPTLYKYGDAHRGPLFPYCEFHPHHSDEPDLHLPRDLYTATYTPNPLQETTTTTHNIKDNMSAQGYYGQGYPPQGGPPPQPGYAPQGYAPQGVSFHSPCPSHLRPALLKGHIHNFMSF